MYYINISEYLEVSDGSKLHYSTWGNPIGIPILFLHGGPGLGCSQTDTDFFNPKTHFVLFLDQRGAPKSQPFGTTDNIHPNAMVDDIIALLALHNIKKCHVFGGSWGSTLALLFAIAHPKMIDSLILRGIFLAHKKGTDILLHPDNAPNCYLKLIQNIPHDRHKDLLTFFCEKMFSDDIEEALYFGKKWDNYAMSLNNSTTQNDFNIEALYKVRLTAWFAKHYCFLPDNHILSNISRIQHIPTTIVHGKYDKITPTFMAQELHNGLKQSKLHLVEAGHFASEKAIFEKLKQTCNRIK